MYFDLLTSFVVLLEENCPLGFPWLIPNISNNLLMNVGVEKGFYISLAPMSE